MPPFYTPFYTPPFYTPFSSLTKNIVVLNISSSHIKAMLGSFIIFSSTVRYNLENSIREENILCFPHFYFVLSSGPLSGGSGDSDANVGSVPLDSAR